MQISSPNTNNYLKKILQKNGFLLRDFLHLNNDKETVLQAVKNNGMALQFASTGLKNDEDIVKSAIQNNGMSLKFASLQIRKNFDIVIMTVKNNILVRNQSFVPEEIRDKLFAVNGDNLINNYVDFFNIFFGNTNINRKRN